MSQKKVDRYKEEKANRQQIMRREKRARRFEIIALVGVFVLLAGWFTTAVVHQARAKNADQIVATEIATGALDSYLGDLSDQLDSAAQE